MMHYHGNFEDIGQWKDKAQIISIFQNVTRSRGNAFWIRALLLLSSAFFMISAGVITHHLGLYSLGAYWDPVRLTPMGDFAYSAQNDNLKYPTCSLKNDALVSNDISTTLIDYTFLSAMIYQDPETHQKTTDEWFGSGVGTLDDHVIREYRKTLKIPHLDVDYDVVSFKNNNSIVVVRGSGTAWVSREHKPFLVFK